MKKSGVFVLFVFIIFLTMSFCSSADSSAEYTATEKSLISTEGFSNIIEFRTPAIGYSDKAEIIIAFTTTAGRTGAGLFIQKFNKDLEPVSSSIRIQDDLLPKQSVKLIKNPLTGNLLLVWQEGLKDQRLKAVLIDNNLNILKRLESAVESIDNQQEPSLAVSANGNFALAWTNLKRRTNTFDEYTIYLKLFDKNLGTLITSKAATFGSEKQFNPSISFFTEDFLSLVYTQSSTPVSFGTNIVIKGHDIATDFLMDSVDIKKGFGNQINPSAISVGEKKLFVIWEDYSKGNSDIIGKIVSQDISDPVQSEEIVIANSIFDERHPVVASAGNKVLVAWVERSSPEKIKAKLFDSEGKKLQEFVLDNSGSFKTNLAIAGYDNHFAIAYEEFQNSKRTISFFEINPLKTEELLKTSVEADITAEEIITESPLEITRTGSVLKDIVRFALKTYKILFWFY